MADVFTLKSSAGADVFDVTDAGVVTATTFVGALTGNVTGTVSGASVTGTLVTATILALPAAAPQTVNMGDAALELVYGIAAGAGQLVVTSSRLNVDAQSGGAGEDLTIDTTASGLVLAISNVGGEDVVVKSNGGSTLATIAAGGTGLVVLGMVILGA